MEDNKPVELGTPEWLALHEQHDEDMFFHDYDDLYGLLNEEA